MKVLVCIPCLLTGGTEIQTLNLMRALVGGGHQVLTACYFEHSEGMVRQYQEAGSEVVCFSPDGNRIGGWRGILFLYRNLLKVVKTFRPDVTHVQYMAPGAIPILLLKLIGVKNILATAHTNADIYPNLKLVHFIQQHCVRAFTCITVIAEKSFFGSSSLFTPDTVLKKHNHFTIYNSLPSYIQIATEERSQRVVLTIGVVSRLEHIKGMDLVVPAFVKVHQECANTRLLVVGDGSQRSLMEQQVKDAGLTDCVTFAGRQGQDTLQGYYDQIDILLMPSRSEGFGLTAIEGMARCCVLVASNTGGLPEVVKDDEVGLLHQPESVEDLAEKILAIVTNKYILHEMQKKVTQYVQQFTFDKYAVLFNVMYSKL